MTDMRDHTAPSQETDWDQVFEAISDPMAILTPDYVVVRANTAYLAWQSITCEQCIGSGCFDHSPSQSGACAGCPLPLTLATGQPRFARQLRMVATTPGGAPVPRAYETWTYPIHDAHGQVIRVVEIIKDVTEREELAQVTREAAALREADQLKSELLGNVSHELRSPLASIKGYAETLLMHEQRLSAAERHEFLQEIVDASDRLEAVIDRMLEMSQLESGTLPLVRSPLNLEQLARVALIAAEAEATARAPESYVFALDSTAMAGDAQGNWILGDACRLRHTLDQLLENAVKYSSQGGKISIILRPATLMGDRGGLMEVGIAAVDLEVRDEGNGIPVAHLDRVFDRFHRVDTRLTREADGLGLGLAIARRIVEMHRGKIWVESTLGSGSSFHVVLPLAAANKSGEEKTVDEIEDGMEQRLHNP